MAAIAPPRSAGSASGEGVWKPLVRAMSASAGGAVGSGLASIAATKILAVTLGPASIALLATLQQLRQTGLVAATANGQTAMIQGASAFEGVSRREYVRTSAVVFVVCTALALSGFVWAPKAIDRWAGLAAKDVPLVAWLGAAVALSSLFVFQTALLNALRAIGTLALVQIAGPAAMALLAWPAARAIQHGVFGVFPAILAASAAASALAAGTGLVRHRAAISEWLRGSGRWWTGEAARHFFSISGAMLFTGLAASLALVTVRARILQTEGLAVTGRFDAAWGISMNQVTLVLASLQTYYLPALARLRTPEERAAQITRVLALAAPAAAAVIAGIALAKPLVLTIFYSKAFLGAGLYLRWTLLGDYLKVASWILSIPMLAAADMRIFLAADLSASGVFLGAATVLARWRTPAESAAMAFVLMHAAHLAICALYVQRRHGFRFRSVGSVLWIAGLAVACAASALSWK